MHHWLKLCYITDFYSPADELLRLRAAIEGGVTLVQLRDKASSPSNLLAKAKQLKQELDSLEIPLIINDHLRLAYEIDAKGVHLGQSDISPVQARKMLGYDKIIGWTVETIEQVRQANDLKILDYIAVSAVFKSLSKSDCANIWGLPNLKQAVEQSFYPVVAIGGINAANVQQVMHQGVTGIAVISALGKAVNPKQAAQALLNYN